MKSKEIQLPDIHHFTSGQDGCRLNKIAITRVSTKIRDGSISEINQRKNGNILTKCDALNPKVHNSTQILHISVPLKQQQELLPEKKILVEDFKRETPGQSNFTTDMKPRRSW